MKFLAIVTVALGLSAIASTNAAGSDLYLPDQPILWRAAGFSELRAGHLLINYPELLRPAPSPAIHKATSAGQPHQKARPLTRRHP